MSGFERYGANPGRSGHKLSMDTALKVYDCREAAANLFSGQVEDVIFTCNCTHALNTAIKGCLDPGDHVIISDLEHNSVLRPVHAMAARDEATYSVAEVDEDDDERTVENFRRLITADTKLIACTHGSNVFGIRLPIEKLGRLCADYNLFFLVDAAQTAGVVEIGMERCGIDFLCTAGHKSLYGPSGTGLLLSPHGSRLRPLMEGGTGSFSADFDMPDVTPDRLESGTVNTCGILGLMAGINFVNERGIDRLYRHEMRIGREIDRRLRRMDGVRMYTNSFTEGRSLPVIAFNIEGIPSEEVTEKLSDLGFALRGGLHCAPLSHRKMGTLESGAARISIGAFNTEEQAERLCWAISRVRGRSKR